MVASVDATAAQQLMLLLPSQLATRVRDQITQSEPISLEVQQWILQQLEQAVRRSSTTANGVKEAHRDPCRNQDSWNHLSAEAIVDAIRSERPSVIAVVIHQLPTEKAISVLSQLGRETSSQVIRRVSHLNEMDTCVKAEIEDYLSSCLGDHQHRQKSEAENARRLAAILEAAPPELGPHWQRAISRDYASSASHPHETYDETPLLTLPLHQDRAASQTDSPGQQLSQLMLMSPTELKSIFGRMDGETLALALAGAPQPLMQHLAQILTPHDFAELEERIRDLDALQIRDIDEAQILLLKIAKEHLGSSSLPLQKAS